MMILCNSKNINDLTVKIGNEKIDNVTCYHDLGIDLDNSLPYNKMLDCVGAVGAH